MTSSVLSLIATKLFATWMTLSWYDLISPPPSTSTHLCLPPSMSACPPQLLQSALAVYLHNYVAPTIGLTSDQGHTCLDLVPTPRTTVHIPFSPFILFA